MQSFVCVSSEPVDVTFRDIFKGRTHDLEKNIDVGQTLLAKLVDSEVITSEHRDDIEVMFVTVDSNA